MSYLYSGEKGIPLREIIKKFGNKKYFLYLCTVKRKDKQ